MSKTAARKGRVSVSSNGGTTFFALNGVISFTFNVELASIDVTSHDSGQYRESIMGHKSATFDMSLWRDEDDPGQNLVFDAVDSATKLVFKTVQVELSGESERIFAANVMSFGESSDLDSAAAIEVSCQVTGDFARQTQA